MKRATLIVAFLLTTLHGSLHAQTNPEKLQKDGNYREAFNGFRKRLETSKSSEPAKDLDLGILYCTVALWHTLRLQLLFLSEINDAIRFF